MFRSLALIACLAPLAGLPACAAPRPAANVTKGRVYFVDVRGADRHPGTERRPVRTIGEAARRTQAGDLVVVRPGTYRESVVLTQSGAPDAPIVFRGLPGAVLSSPDTTQSLSAFDINGTSAYVAVQGFELTGGYAETVFVRPGAHDVELAGLHIHDNRTGIWIAGASSVRVRDSLIEGNYRTGIRIFAGAHHVAVADTRSERNDDGKGCDGDSDGFNADASTSDIVFERATAVGNSEDGFDLQGPNVTLLQVTATENGCSGVKVGGGGYLENALIANNRTGINVNGGAASTTGASTNGARTTVVANCTLSQNGLGVRARGANHTLMLRNSIVAGAAKALSYPGAVQLIESHNIFYRPLQKDRLIVRLQGDSEAVYSGEDINAGRWQRDSGEGERTVSRDPRLDADGCRPRRDSEAIDSGDDAAAPPMDLAGMPRPLGAAVDRGAFEWAPAVANIRIGRVLLRTDGTGTGSVRLQAEIDLPRGIEFDPLTDRATVSLRGPRGAIVQIDVPPWAWKRSRLARGTALRAEGAAAAGRSAHVTLQVRPDTLWLSLKARGADVWAADDRSVSLRVELGQVHTRVEKALRRAGRRLSLH